MKIRTKLLILLLTMSLLPFTFLGLLTISNVEKILNKQAQDKLSLVASMKEARINDFISNNNERIAYVTSRLHLKQELEKYNKNKSQAAVNIMNNNLLTIIDEVPHLNEISVLNLDGKVISSTNADIINTYFYSKDLFEKGKTKNALAVFFTDSEGNLNHYLMGPLELDKKIIGVVIIECRGDDFLDIFDQYIGLGETGESVLARKDIDGAIISLIPLRFNKDAQLSKILNANDTSKPIIKALNKEENIFTDTIDYRNVPVYAATRYIDAANWGLVVKIDRDEILAPVRTMRLSLVTLMVIVTSFSIITALAIAKSFTDPLLNLKSAAERLANDDLSARSEVNSNDEIGMLSRTFNQMAIDLEVYFNMLNDTANEKSKIHKMYKNLLAKTHQNEKRFKNLSVEDQITELKDEVEELQKKEDIKLSRHTKVKK